MKNRLYIFIISIIIFIVCFGIWIILPELYFRIKYGESYNEKAIFASKKSLSAQFIEQETTLQPPRQRQSFFIDVPLNAFNRVKNAKVLISQKSLKLIPDRRAEQYYAQADISLDNNYVDLINGYEYSLSFSVLCESNSPMTTFVSISVNNDQIYSPSNIAKQDIITAVLPMPKNRLKSNRVIIKLATDGSSSVIFKDPKIVFTPFYTNLINKNYRESFNFKKDNNKKRILAIGGSTTYGTGSTINCSWPFILQQKLEYLYPNKFEIINLGTWGGSIRDFIASYDNILWQRFGKDEYETNQEMVKDAKKYPFGYKDLNPDMVLLSVSWNDLTYSLLNDLYLNKPFLLGKSLYEINKKFGPKLCKNASGLFILRALNRIAGLMLPLPDYINKETIENKFKNFDNIKLDYSSLFHSDAEQVESIIDNFQKDLCTLVDSFKGKNIDVALMILPSLVYTKHEDYSQIKRNGWNERSFLLNYWVYSCGGLIEKNIINKVGNLKSVKVYDMSFIFADEIAKKRNEIFTDLVHFTDRGNGYISSLLILDFNSNKGKVLTDGKI